MIDVKKVEGTLKLYFVSDDHYRAEISGILNNGEVIAASTGHVFAEIQLMVYPDLSEIKDTVPESVKFPDYVAKGLIPRPPKKETFTVGLETLFTNPDDIVEADDETSEPCETCFGTGLLEHDCGCEYCTYLGDEECWDCGGSGKIYKNREHTSYTHINDARFRSIYLNRAVLLFRCFGITSVDIYQKTSSSALLIKSDGVTCIVMPVLLGELQHNQSIVNEITIGNQEVTA